VKRKLKSLRAYYKFLNYTYGIPNLMAEENIIGQLKDDAKKIEDNYFTDDEIKKLFKYIDGLKNDKGYRDRAMLYFLYYTGCRRSEMLNIKWSDIDMIDKTVRIYRSKTHNWGRVNLHEKVIKEIVRYSDIYGYKSDYVFPKPSDMDSPFDGNTFYDRFRSLMKRSGVTRTGLSPHSMRHTFVTKTRKLEPRMIQ
jgi:integrase/recombinase XerD